MSPETSGREQALFKSVTLHKPTAISGARHSYRDRARKLWLTLHFYIGVLAGAFFVLLGLTGSILSFRAEIDHWLNRDIMTVALPSGGAVETRPFDQLIEAATAAAPSKATPIFVHFPRTPETALDVVFSMTDGHADHRYHQIFVNPYDGNVTGFRMVADMTNHFREPFVNIIMHLHYSLLLGDAGATFVGFVGLSLFASFVSGLYLWWPRNGKWRQALTIKPHASSERTVFDVHRTVGVYLSITFLIMAFTGVYMIFTPQARALIGLFSPVNIHLIPENVKSQPSDGRRPITAGEAVAATERRLTDGQLLSLQLPDGPEGVYIVGKRADDEVNRTEPNRLVAIDQYTGDVIRIQDPHDYTPGERILEWQYPLHSGEAFGNVGRALICVLGLAPALMYATGLIRWMQKKRARRRPA